jgi:hypothetical protein
MRSIKVVVAFLMVASSVFQTGCCRKWCNWGRRPYYQCEPQVVTPCTPCPPACPPYVSESQPLPRQGYETGNQ